MINADGEDVERDPDVESRRRGRDDRGPRESLGNLFTIGKTFWFARGVGKLYALSPPEEEEQLVDWFIP